MRQECPHEAGTPLNNLGFDSALCLHDYATRHLGMHSAEVAVFSRFGETELEFVVCIEFG